MSNSIIQNSTDILSNTRSNNNSLPIPKLVEIKNISSSSKPLSISKAREIRERREKENSDQKVLKNRPPTTVSLPGVNITMQPNKNVNDTKMVSIKN